MDLKSSFLPLSRKGLHLVAASKSETSCDPSSIGVSGELDVANLILRLLPSKDGYVLRRLLMTAVSIVQLQAASS